MVTQVLRKVSTVSQAIEAVYVGIVRIQNTAWVTVCLSCIPSGYIFVRCVLLASVENQRSRLGDATVGHVVST